MTTCVLVLLVAAASQAPPADPKLVAELNAPTIAMDVGDPRKFNAVLGRRVQQGKRLVTQNAPAPPTKEKGAMIVGLDEGAPAEEGGLQRGDIILYVDGVEIESPEDLKSKLTPQVGKAISFSGKRLFEANNGRRYWDDFAEIVTPVRARDTLLASLKTDVDAVTDAKRIKHPNSTDNVASGTEVVPFILQEKGKPPVFCMRLQYAANDWLFVERFTLRGKDKAYEVPASYFTVDRDNSARRVWEWYSVKLDQKLLPAVFDMAAADKPIVRYHGKSYAHDHELTERERAVLKKMAKAWYALTLP